VTDLLANLPPPERPAAASNSEWTEARAAAARARLETLVRQVLDRMPPPMRVAPPVPAPERFEETDAFRRAVAALMEG
jgi:hypothetical protein